MVRQYRKNTGRDDAFRDSKVVMGLDRYGFPAAPLANSLLVGFDDFGDSTRELEEGWYDWLNFYPFDMKVAEKLAWLYGRRIESLDPARDGAQVDRLRKKLEVVKSRVERYGAAFSG